MKNMWACSRTLFLILTLCVPQLICGQEEDDAYQGTKIALGGAATATGLICACISLYCCKHSKNRESNSVIGCGQSLCCATASVAAAIPAFFLTAVGTWLLAEGASDIDKN